MQKSKKPYDFSPTPTIVLYDIALQMLYLWSDFAQQGLLPVWFYLWKTINSTCVWQSHLIITQLTAMFPIMISDFAIAHIVNTSMSVTWHYGI